MTADREVLADALFVALNATNPLTFAAAGNLADALLPVVDRIANQRAAAELRDAWPSVWRVLDSYGYGQSAMALQASDAVAARAAALDPS